MEGLIVPALPWTLGEVTHLSECLSPPVAVAMVMSHAKD